MVSDVQHPPVRVYNGHGGYPGGHGGDHSGYASAAALSPGDREMLSLFTLVDGMSDASARHGNKGHGAPGAHGGHGGPGYSDYNTEYVRNTLDPIMDSAYDAFRDHGNYHEVTPSGAVARGTLIGGTAGYLARGAAERAGASALVADTVAARVTSEGLKKVLTPAAVTGPTGFVVGAVSGVASSYIGDGFFSKVAVGAGTGAALGAAATCFGFGVGAVPGAVLGGISGAADWLFSKIF